MKLKDMGILPEKEPYQYLKSRHLRQSRKEGRKRVYGYCSIIGEKDIEVTKEEYEFNIEQSKKDSMDAFMSRGTKEVYYNYYINNQKEIDNHNQIIDEIGEIEIEINQEKCAEVLLLGYTDPQSVRMARAMAKVINSALPRVVRKKGKG